MKKFNMKRLLSRYKESLYAITYEEVLVPPGKWELVETKTFFNGVVTNISDDILVAGEGGVYTSKSKMLYCYEDFEVNDKIHRQDTEYTVTEIKEFDSRDMGLRRYIVRTAD